MPGRRRTCADYSKARAGSSINLLQLGKVSQMPLSDEQKEKFGAWLHSRDSNPDCPSCGHNEWSFGDIIAVPVYPHGENQSEEPALMAQLICKHCAFIRLHAARPIGLLKDE